MLTIAVGVAVVVVGVLAIALIGPGGQAVLQAPDRIGLLERTPSEEVMTSTDMIATYTAGPHVVVLSVKRTDGPTDEPPECVSASGSTQCQWIDDGLDYTLVENSMDNELALLFSRQAQESFQAANRR